MATHTRPAARLSRVLLLALISRIAVLSFMLVSDVAFSKLDSSSSLIDFPCLPRRQETDHKEERVLAAPFSSFFSSVPSVFAPASTSASTSSPQTLRDSHSHPPSAREACSKSHACSGRMVVWDTVYFVRIAKCGYEYDLTHAFFPLMPLLMRAFASIMSFGMMGRLCEETAYAVAGILINVVAFCVAAAALYRLTWTTTRDEELAVTSVIFFCFNPASVFYSAVYTESLFTALTWVGMICLPEPFWSAVICFALASAARSNGILACWFLIHRLAVMIFQKRRRNSLWWECCRTTIGCAMICTPYVWMQSMAYDNFCRSSSLQDVGLNPHDTEYCQKTLPSMYGYVQEKYWDVGFLRFYRKLDRVSSILYTRHLHIDPSSTAPRRSVHGVRCLPRELLYSRQEDN